MFLPVFTADRDFILIRKTFSAGFAGTVSRSDMERVLKHIRFQDPSSSI